MLVSMMVLIMSCGSSSGSARVWWRNSFSVWFRIFRTLFDADFDRLMAEEDFVVLRRQERQTERRTVASQRSASAATTSWSITTNSCSITCCECQFTDDWEESFRFDRTEVVLEGVVERGHCVWSSRKIENRERWNLLLIRSLAVSVSQRNFEWWSYK